MTTYKARKLGWYVPTVITLLAAVLILSGILIGRATVSEPDPEIIEIPAVLEPLGLRDNIQDLIEWQQAINAEQAALDAEVGVLVEGAAMFASTPHTTAPPPSITTTTAMTAPAEAQTD